MSHIVAVFGSSQTRPLDTEYRDAHRLGALLADAGYTVATGGYAGTMEAVSAGAAGQGGPVIGVTAPSVFPGRPGANRYVTDERTAATISERIHRLVDLADAHIALPGSLGTFTEMVVAWNDRYVAPMAGRRPKPLVAVGRSWATLIGGLTSNLGLEDSPVTVVSTVEEVVPILRDHFGVAAPPATG